MTTELEKPDMNLEEQTAGQTMAPAEEEQNSAPSVSKLSKDEIIDSLRKLIEGPVEEVKDEVDELKQAYYKMRNAEVASAREAFIAGGGEPDTFMPPADADEERFKTLMNSVKERRAQLHAEQEREKQVNLERKQAIIERIKEMAATPDSADKAYNEFKQLQAEWKEIKNVPAEQASELWKNYQHNVEQFYDQLRLNHEFRAYDFKKNLEIKMEIK